jgi:acyl-coenzyme A thioesterase PaaI-like protein
MTAFFTNTVGGNPNPRHVRTGIPTGELMAVMHRRLAGTSVEGGLGVAPTAVDHGRIELELPLTPAMVGPTPDSLAMLHAALAVLCDAGLGLAATASREDFDGGVTLDLRVDLIRDVPAHARRLVLVGHGVTASAEHSVARAEVHDGDGCLIAQASGTLAASHDWPMIDPAAGRPRPLLDLATVFAGIAVDADGTVRIPVRPETENTRGIMHGAMLVAAALGAASAVRAGEPPARLLWFAAEFLRPVPAEIGELRARVEPVRNGRRFRSDRVDVVLPDGRTAVTVTCCTAVLG